MRTLLFVTLLLTVPAFIMAGEIGTITVDPNRDAGNVFVQSSVEIKMNETYYLSKGGVVVAQLTPVTVVKGVGAVMRITPKSAITQVTVGDLVVDSAAAPMTAAAPGAVPAQAAQPGAGLPVPPTVPAAPFVTQPEPPAAPFVEVSAPATDVSAPAPPAAPAPPTATGSPFTTQPDSSPFVPSQLQAPNVPPASTVPQPQTDSVPSGPLPFKVIEAPSVSDSSPFDTAPAQPQSQQPYSAPVQSSPFITTSGSTDRPSPFITAPASTSQTGQPQPVQPAVRVAPSDQPSPFTSSGAAPGFTPTQIEGVETTPPIPPMQN